MFLIVIPLLCIWLAVVAIVMAACQVTARADRDGERRREHAAAPRRGLHQRSSRQRRREQRVHASLRRRIPARRARV